MSVDDITESWHALDRWMQRADPDLDALPSDAWHEAHEMGFVPAGSDAAEIRYHRETNTALLRRQAEIVTVLSMDPADIDSEQGRAIKQAVEAQFGAIEHSLSTDNRDTEHQP